MRFIACTITLVVGTVFFGPVTAQESPAKSFDFFALYKLKNPIRCLAVHPSGKTILCGGGDFKAIVGATFDIFVVDTESGTILRRVKGHTNYVNAMQFDKEGRIFLVADEAGEAVIYSFEKRIEEKVSRRFPSAIVDAYLLGNGRAVLLVRDKGIFVWDYAKDTIAGSIVYARFKDFRMHPDGKTVVATTVDGSLLFWEIDAGKPKRTISFRKDDPPWSLALSPDGKMIALGHGGVGVVLVYPMDDFSKPIRFDGQNDIIHLLAFTPDGRYLFSGCELAGFGKNGIVAWDIHSKKKVVDYKHTASLTALQIWPKGDYVAGADQYGQLFLLKATLAKNKK